MCIAETLYRKAKEISANAYAPFSGFKVGAALMTKNGKIYTGVNVENSSYGGTVCAERTAAVKAVSDGEREFEAIAVFASTGNGTETLPCGICRQFLYEFSPDIKVIYGENESELKIKILRELLPHGFSIGKQ